MSSQILDNASGYDDEEHDGNEVGPPPLPPSNPPTEHKAQRRPRKQHRRPQCDTKSHK